MSLDFGEGAAPQAKAQLALARKWRPRRFAEVVGQGHAVRTLSHALASGRLHHAYMFTGTRGIGKTTLARILAKGFNCQQAKDGEPCCECPSCTQVDAGSHPDVIEMDAASTTQVDSMRELLETANYAPAAGPFKVYIIDEVHMLSRHSFNAMLKTLEEPPAHVKFILATTDPQQVPATVQSRCLLFALRRLPPAEIAAHLAKVLQAEGGEHDGDALEVVASRADGSVRDALSVLDELLAAGGELRAEVARSLLGMASADMVERLLEKVVAGDAAGALEISAGLHEEAVNLDWVLESLAAAVHRGQLARVSKDLAPAAGEAVSGLEPIAAQLLYEVATRSRATLPVAPDPKAAFDMALLRMVALLDVGPAPAGEKVERAQKATKGKKSPSPQAETADSSAPAVLPATSAEWMALCGALGPREASLASRCSFVSAAGTTLSLSLGKSDGHLLKFEEALVKDLRGRYGEAVEVAISDAPATSKSPASAQDEREREKRDKAKSDMEGSEVMGKIRDAFPDSVIKSVDSK